MAEQKEEDLYLDMDVFRPGKNRMIKLNGVEHGVKDADTMTLGDWLDLGELDKKMKDVFESNDASVAIEAGVAKIRLLIPSLTEETLRSLEAGRFLELLDFVSRQAKVSGEQSQISQAGSDAGKVQRRRGKSASRRR